MLNDFLNARHNFAVATLAVAQKSANPGLHTLAARSSAANLEAIRAGCDLPIWELLDFLGRGEAPDPERQAAEDALLRASRRLDPALLAVAVEQVQALVRYAGPAE